MGKIFSHDFLIDFTEKIFLKLGCPPTDAKLAAEVLVKADLRGIDSHGIARLNGYVRLTDLKRLNPQPDIKIIHESPSTAVIDGDAGLGLVVAPHAMKIAIKKAKIAGTGWVAIKNSNHFGIAAYHAMLALEHDMIGFVMTHAGPLVAPTFSKDKLLGTNPICVAIPAGNEAPFVMDMATTTAAYGKLEILQRKNLPAPDGWAQDKFGRPTNDANAVKNGGALLPLGGDRERGSHKGYALGAWVDIFCGVLSGASYGPWVPPFATAGFMNPSQEKVGEGTGHFVGAMRIDAFRKAEDFKFHMDNWIKAFKKATPVEGFEKVIIPGEPEVAIEADRLRNGIPVMPVVIDSLKILAQRFGLPDELSKL